MLAALATLVVAAAAALHAHPRCSSLATSVPQQRKAVAVAGQRGTSIVMADSAEEEAKKRMLERLNQGPSWNRPSSERQSQEDQMLAAQKEREEARKRMAALMDGSAKAKVAQSFGYGMEDDEDYGYGPERPRLVNDEIDLLSGRLVDDGKPRGDGFGGQVSLFGSRKAEARNVGPAPMENTLREPGQLSKPAEQPPPESGVPEGVTEAVVLTPGLDVVTVQVPAGKGEGDALAIRGPNGTYHQVIVPPGIGPGGTFQAQFPSA